MPEIDSTDYHDFVFREGRLVGEFEQMYRKSAEVPWHQDRDEDRLDCHVAMQILGACAAQAKTVAEVGCGLGFFADMIARTLPGSSVTGFDISTSAVAKAAALFPGLRFEVIDVSSRLVDAARHELVCIRGCFWYLFPHLDVVLENLAAMTDKGGLLFVAQNFPPLDKDFIGKDTIPSPEALSVRLSERFEPVVECRLDDRATPGGNDLWLIYLGRKRSA